ncbi:hypothetical protein BDL97_10G011000 [Sphagnum fallax]|nr:hypothetical protein BDL97_10G011000 [Sphagnum fallax]
MHLTALHITGLWLQYPTTAIFYVEQLKLLTLHGGEAVDEELDGELVESQVGAREYSMLIQSSDIELAERAQVSQDSKVLAIAKSAATCGQMLLLELLNAAVDDPNLSKELYKKKSLQNNMPSVRQYIEAFAVHIYLRFPSLVEMNLIPLLQDHNIEKKALSSYVLIATNVLLCTSRLHNRTCWSSCYQQSCCT